MLWYTLYFWATQLFFWVFLSNNSKTYLCFFQRESYYTSECAMSLWATLYEQELKKLFCWNSPVIYYKWTILHYTFYVTQKSGLFPDYTVIVFLKGGVRRSQRRSRSKALSWLDDSQMHKVGYPNLNVNRYSEEDSRDDVHQEDDRQNEIAITRRSTRRSGERKSTKYLYEYAESVSIYF